MNKGGFAMFTHTYKNS